MKLVSVWRDDPDPADEKAAPKYRFGVELTEKEVFDLRDEAVEELHRGTSVFRAADLLDRYTSLQGMLEARRRGEKHDNKKTPK